MDEVKFPAKIEPPPEKGCIMFRPPEDGHAAIRGFLKENNIKGGDTIHLTMALEKPASVRAKNLFHAIRDRIVKETSGHLNREDKDIVKRSLKKDFGPEPILVFEDVLSHEKSFEVKSTADYTSPEMWTLITGSAARAEDVGADIHHLGVEISEIGVILNEESKTKDDGT